MGFGEAIGAVYGKYAVFQGRSARPEFWWFALYVVIVSIAFDIGDHLSLVIKILGVIWSFGTAIPNLAVTVRRLHDSDRSGWWVLIGLVPILGWIVLLILCAQPGTPGFNRFG